jgi:protein gp37
MSDKSGIQWTDATWNPTSGCDRVSPGCDHCYAMTLAKRLKAMGSPRYQVDGDPRTSGPGFGVQTHAVALDQPVRWKRPRRIFVNSMSDLFHKDIPDAFIARVFAVMACAPQHTFQLLTKRHARLRSLLEGAQVNGFMNAMIETAMRDHGLRGGIEWPLPNVWLGVSVEDQHWADIRIPALLDTPAAVRFLSCEPLLSAIDFGIGDPHRDHESDDVNGFPHPRICLTCSGEDGEPEVEYFRRDYSWSPEIHWVIIGGESGPGARPMDPDWVRSIVSECRDAGVTPFVKQLGAVWAREHGGDSHGGDWDLWPADLRVREFPAPVPAAA